MDRAAHVIACVVGADTSVSFTEVVEQTGLSRSTASRLLQALERNALLDRDPDGRYRGGAMFTQFAARFDRVDSLSAAAGSTLQRLSEETGEASHLAVPSGGKVVQVAQIDSTYLLGSGNWVDIDVPPHCSALGKVLYAFDAIPLPTGRLERRATRTLTTRSALLADLEEIRESGFAVAHDELEDGLDALAAPIAGPGGGVIAAVGISGPTLRLEPDHARLGALLVREAETLSRSLQRQVPPLLTDR
ncbi:IclR family transcriptional regulator [Leucobacter sp. Psy1]|uniref:IclR family transcriptional regulator n=1 Tax=Leucobacter sp. Psy1 TaxID=2875729 RepID=UPI001CD45E06|nr:IclR family transcriptional regulator [Leucobacter sp. Psy1]